MKNLLYIFVIFTTVGCGKAERKTNSSTSERIELIPEQDKEVKEKYEKAIEKDSEQINAITCFGNAIDFMKLKDIELQKDFFAKLDSIKKVQYPENNQETCNSVDITQDLLNKFLKDINKKIFIKEGEFTSFYNFNLACPDYLDSEVCKDKVSLQFFEKSCVYRMSIENSYLVNGDCIGGSQVIYGFRIYKRKIVDFWRQEAG